MKRRQLKLLEWKEKLKNLEEITLPQALKRVGAAGAEGDLRENIAYEEAEREVYRLQDKIDEVKRIIVKTKKEIKDAGCR